jgi:deoxyribonuclease-4
MYPKLGFHVSISGGISNSIDNALKIGCSTFQIFSRNPRGWVARPLQDEDVENFRKKLSKSKIDRESVFIHMPYLPNLSSSDSKLHKKSTDTLVDELSRSSILGIHYLILHLGSHGGKGKANGINQLMKACNFAFDNYYKLSSSAITEKKKSDNNGNCAKDSITLILENSAGEKKSIASKFDELALILDKLKSSMNRGSFGICLDTCHVFAAGYDLRTDDVVDDTLDKFNSEVGLENLKVIHLNDSKDELNSNRDRHEHIGMGKIGKKGLRALLNHKAASKLPIIMETPVDGRRKDADNMKVVLDMLDKE